MKGHCVSLASPRLIIGSTFDARIEESTMTLVSKALVIMAPKLGRALVEVAHIRWGRCLGWRCCGLARSLWWRCSLTL
jgi:hypothetical protein